MFEDRGNVVEADEDGGGGDGGDEKIIGPTENRKGRCGGWRKYINICVSN